MLPPQPLNPRSIFTTEKLPDALMNTTYLDTCCNVLEAKMEYDSDVDLVQLVRIQKLAQSIAVTWDVNSPSLPSTHLPPTMIIQAFQEQLDSFRANLPPHLQENGRPPPPAHTRPRVDPS